MEKTKIDRINELARLSRERELTADEKKEQQLLRQEYLDAIKKNFRSTLESIRYTDEIQS